MTPEEIKEHATKRLGLLRDARTWLHFFQHHHESANGGTAGANNQARAARDSYNQVAREVSRALEEVGVSTHELMRDGAGNRDVNVVEDACVVERWNWLALQHATQRIELAAGEWKRIEKDPSHLESFKRNDAPELNVDSTPELKEELAKLRAGVDSIAKPEPWLRSHWLSVLGFGLPAAALFFAVGKAVVSSELESARAKVTVELAPVVASVTALTSRVKALETRDPEPLARAPASAPSANSAPPPECARLPKYLPLTCIETNEGVKQPNTMVAKIPFDYDAPGTLEQEQHRLSLLFRKHDPFEDWSGRFLLLSNGKQRQLLLTQTEPGRAYELCRWLDACDNDAGRLDPQLRACSPMNTMSGAKICRKGVFVPPAVDSSRP